MKNVLLLGKTGQIGHELLNRLSTIGTVHAPPHAEADLCRPEQISEVIQGIRPDIIVNAAGYTDVDGAEERRELAFMLNGVGPGVLGALAAELDAILVHYSTDYVFDGRSDRPYVEGDQPAPLNVYGESKLEGEKAVLSSGCRALIFRTGWVYGLRGTNFLLTVQRLANEGDRLRIVNDQVGSPTWSRSVAECSVAVLQRVLDQDEFAGGVFHMSCGGKASWFDFACAIVGSGLPVEPIDSTEMDRPAKRPKYSVLDNSRLRETFGLEMPTWRAGLRACVESEHA